MFKDAKRAKTHTHVHIEQIASKNQRGIVECYLIYTGPLGTNIENANFRVRHTTEVARLDVRLVFAVAVAFERTATVDTLKRCVKGEY